MHKDLIEDILAGKYKRRYQEDGRAFYLKVENQELFKQLESAGMLEFYTSNKGQIFQEAQIVCFLAWGVNALKNGYRIDGFKINVHHKDGNVQNSKPSNLVYLSADDHLLVSNYTDTLNKGQTQKAIDNYAGERTPFNRQGKPIRNHHRFLAAIVIQTQAATTIHRSGRCVTMSVVKLLRLIPKHLVTAPSTWLDEIPGWFSEQLVRALRPDLNFTYA
jgi:hypothetical protein